MDSDQTAAAQTPAPRPPIRGAEADPRPCRTDGDLVCAPQWHSVEHAAPGDGLRLREHLLAPARAVATRGRVETIASGLAHRIAPAWPTRSGADRGRQRFASRVARGKKTGP